MENAYKRELRRSPLYLLLWTVLGLFYFSQGLTQRLASHDTPPPGGITWLRGSWEPMHGHC